MTELQGSAAKLAYGRASVWGTAVTCGDGDQVEYASETVTPSVELAESDQITGDALTGRSDINRVVTQGDIAGMDLLYEGHERFFEDVFGDRDTTGSAGVFQHVFNWMPSNSGKFGTLAIDKAVGVHEVDSFKPMGFTIVGAGGQPTKMTIRGIGRQLRMDDPGRTNDASTSWALSGLGGAPKTRRAVKFGHAVVEVGPVGGALVTYCPIGFTISGQRTGDPVQTTCSGDYSDEPATDSSEITLQLDFDIYNDDNDVLAKAYLAGSSFAAKITFDSGVDLGAGPANRRMILWIPEMQFTSGYPNVSGKGKVPLSVSAKVVSAATAVDTDATMPRLYIHSAVADPDDYTNV